MKKYFYCILLVCITFSFAKSSPLRERVYVQTDKHLYLAGEPVLMKLFTTDEELIPLVFSKIAYVELVNDTVAQIQTKVELTNGTGSGIMLLPADLPTGYYRLIAYTRYMRNESADVFFEKNIAVLNTFQSGYQPGEVETTGTDYSLPLTEYRNGAVSLQPNKSTYTTREHGELALSGLPENIYTLSVSISGKDFIPVVESDVSLLLKNRTKKTEDFTGSFLPEYEGHIVTGKIIDNQTGEETADETFLTAGLSFPTVNGIRFFTGQKNETGDFSFFTSGISGTKEIAAVLYNADEKYRIDIQSPFVTRYVPKQMSSLHIDSAYYSRLLERSVALQVFRYFSEDPSENRSVSESNFKIEPTWSYPLDEYTRFTTMREVFIEFILGARFSRNAGKQEISVLTKRGDYYDYGTIPLVLLDGVPVADHDAIYNYNPLSVEQINIYYGPYIIGGYQFDGIVELLTYRRSHNDLNLNRSTQVLAYEGPQLPYRLDIPDYSEEKNRDSRMPDTRHTLLWNPDVRTDGKTSFNLPFDTSDLAGEFQVTVEGITKDGEIVFATAFFNVGKADFIAPPLELVVDVPLKTAVFQPDETSALNPPVSLELEYNEPATEKPDLTGNIIPITTPPAEIINFFTESTEEVEKIDVLPDETSALNPPDSLELEYNETATEKPDLTENIIPITTPPAETNNFPTESTEKAVMEEKINPNIKYHIIVGSFMLFENAQRQANALTEKGFTPEIIPTSDGFFRVSAIEYFDIETARLRKEDFLYTFPGAWILETRYE